jgi:hypothetical protein
MSIHSVFVSSHNIHMEKYNLSRKPMTTVSFGSTITGKKLWVRGWSGGSCSRTQVWQLTSYKCVRRKQEQLLEY